MLFVLFANVTLERRPQYQAFLAGQASVSNSVIRDPFQFLLPAANKSVYWPAMYMEASDRFANMQVLYQNTDISGIKWVTFQSL